MWCFSYFPDGLKKRACRYLLQRYLGQFLLKKLSLDQLRVDLYNGTGNISDVYLDVKALNEIGESYNLPLEFVDGYVSSISVSIPWSAPIKESSEVKIVGLMLTLQAKKRNRNVSTFESLWDSMCSMSSMQLAKDLFAETEEEEEEDFRDEIQPADSSGEPIDGLTRFANTIDAVFRRVRVTFTDIVFRVEHVPRGSKEGLAVEFRIKQMDYFDESGQDNQGDQSDKEEFQLPSPLSVRNFRIHGLSIFTDHYMPGSVWPNSSCTSSMHNQKSPDLSLNDFQDTVQELVSPQGTPVTESILSPDEGDDSNPVLISRLAETLEIRLSLKQDEALAGPKVYFELNSGMLPLLLNPSQVHLLWELGKALYMPDNRSPGRGNQAQGPTAQHWNKPMSKADFNVVEQDLQKQLGKPQSHGRSLRQPAHQAWSSHSLDGSEENFQPARSRLPIHMSNNSVANGSEMDNSFSSLYTGMSDLSISGDSLFERASSTKTGRTIGTVQELLLEDGQSEQSTFRLTIGSLFLVLLHEDVSPLTPTCTPNKDQWRITAETFFDTLQSTLSQSRVPLAQLAMNRSQLTGICSLSHVRLFASPLTMEGHQRSTISEQLLTTVFTIAHCDILECLVEKLALGSSYKPTLDVSYTELLKFSSEHASTEMALRVKYEHKENLVQMHRGPHTAISCKLGSFTTEVDISIIDRLQALFKTPSFNHWASTSTDFVAPNAGENCFTAARTDIDISSPNITVKLRFPVPDLRSVFSQERAPWWQKSLRQESLIFELSQVSLKTSYDSRPLKVELQCREAHGLMEMNKDELPIAFVCISFDPKDDPNFQERGFDLPRLVLMVNPVANPLDAEVLEEEPEDLLPMNSVHAFQLKHQEPSPFTCRRVAYDGNTSQTTREYDSITPECTDQVVLPADKDQMAEFMDKTLSRSRITLEFSLPSVHVHFPSKHFYEILFNRLLYSVYWVQHKFLTNGRLMVAGRSTTAVHHVASLLCRLPPSGTHWITTDLLLWTPAAPHPMYSSDHFDYQSNHTLKESTHFQAFTFCKSGAQNESSSDSEDGGTYHTMHDGTFQFFRPGGSQPARQSNLTYKVNIIQGIFNFRAPLLDGQSEPVDDFCGEFEIHAKNGTIFGVSGHNGDPHVSYTCFTLNDGAFFHQGKVPRLSSPKRLSAAYVNECRESPGPVHLKKTLYRTGPEVLCAFSSSAAFQGPEMSDLFSLVVRAGLDDIKRLKTFKIALGLQEAALRHRMSLTQQSWLMQLLDFFDVANHPVAGYNPPAVITELNLHLRFCAIDYRPLYLPVRALATVENFSISSNLAAQSTTSLLRIISEELSLFISNKKDTKTADIRKHYVCVLDTGLFDFSLRKTDGKDPKVPELDLRASNNMVHIHTCADSCRALQELIQYLVSDGDLMGESTDFFDAEDYPSVFQGDNGAPSLVGRLMADAMLESPVGSNNGDVLETLEEEKQVQEQEEEEEEKCEHLFGSASESDDQFRENFFEKKDAFSDSDDEDFCILEDDLGTGILPPNGDPQVRQLCPEPLMMIENHFKSPYGRQDQLKAPADYPPPLRSYMLREMSLVWHLYGGNDFQQTQKNEPEKKTRVVIDETQDWNNEYSSPGVNIGLDGLNSVSFRRGQQHESVWDNLHSEQDEVDKKLHFKRTPTPGSDSVNRSPKWGGKTRRQDVCVELQMNKVRFQHEEYAPSHSQASRQVMLVQEIEIRDRLASSDFNKFLYQFTSEANPRQTHANMLVIKATHVRTNPNNPSTSECSLRVSLQPLRLNIDQDTLLFLCNFFTELNNPDSCADGPTIGQVVQEQQKGDNLEDVMNGEFSDGDVSVSRQSSSSPTYFRSFVFSPEVLIQLDYQGKRVQMEQGALAGLLMGLAQLNRSKIMLKRLSYRHGLLGVDRLFAYAVHEWLQDIKKSQLPSLLGGVGPMASFVQLFQGIRDLIWLPIEQYRKDGRLMRGLQRGANSFTTSTAMAALELTGRLVHLIQGAAEFAYDMVSPGPRVKNQHVRQIVGPHQHYSEPRDIREGVAKAYHVVREGLGDAARTVVRVAAEEHEHKGVPGAVGGVLRQIPPFAVKPILLATEATRNVIEGVRYQLAPDARKEAEEKWRGRKNH